MHVWTPSGESILASPKRKRRVNDAGAKCVFTAAKSFSRGSQSSCAGASLSCESDCHSCAIFSVINAVLLKPILFPDPDRLVQFMNTAPQGSNPAASPAKFQHWREQNLVVQDVSAFRTGIVNYTGGGFPEQLGSAQGAWIISGCLALQSFADAHLQRPRICRTGIGWSC